MKSGDLAEYLCDLLQIPAGTASDYLADLRGAGLLSKGTRGRYSGADMTESDCINALLALLIEHGRGESVARNVRSVRAIRFDKAGGLPRGKPFGSNLEAYKQATFGSCLDALVRDIRAGRFDGLADAAEKPYGGLSFDFANRLADLSLSLPAASEGSFYWRYGTAPVGLPKITRRVNVDIKIFCELADMLGPVPDA